MGRQLKIADSFDALEPVDFDVINIGDYLQAKIGTGTRLKGGYLSGVVVEKHEPHRFLKLESGWCIHETDYVVVHEVGREQEGDGGTN